VAEAINNLIIVPGHAAFKDSVREVPAEPSDDEYWVLQSFQAGEPAFYIEHIKYGVELVKKDLGSVALMSGGRTRLEAGRWSEAATYAEIAKACKYWKEEEANVSLGGRIGVEIYARDSLENLQNSLYRYYQIIGKYPQRVTVVGWAFKESRFDYHRETLGIPESRFTYVGVNNPPDLNGALVGENKTLEAFRADPWAKEGSLHQKRQERNPFNETDDYGSLPPIVIG
jgi:hypothetical protein